MRSTSLSGRAGARRCSKGTGWPDRPEGEGFGNGGGADEGWMGADVVDGDAGVGAVEVVIRTKGEGE